MIFLFVVFSIPTFILYAFNGTFLEPKFYSEKIGEQSYDFLLRNATQNILDNNEIARQYFDFNQLRNEISKVFTPGLFEKMLNDFVEQLMKIKQKNTSSLTISFVPFRESLMTTAYNLAFQIYKKIPICAEDVQFSFDNQPIPECLPADLEYEVAVKPLTQNFENTIYRVIPADATLNKSSETQFIYNFFQSFDQIRFIFLGILIGILGLIALILRKPFSVILKYESYAFILSGAAGLTLSMILPAQLLNTFLGHSSKSLFKEYIQFLLDFPAAEIQKLALIFLVLGLGLFLIYFFLKKNLD